MKNLEEVITTSSVLQYGEVALTLQYSFTISNEEDGEVLVGIYLANFDPEFTGNSGYIYLVDNSLYGLYRSRKYYHTPNKAEEAFHENKF